MTKPARESGELDCVSGIDDLWRVVADTDRMGRAMGFDKIEVTPLDGPGAARHLVRTKLAGLTLEYEERPFEWDAPYQFTSKRVCRKGPLKYIATTWALTARPGGGTHVRLEVELEPSTALLGPIARAAAGKSVTSHLRVVRDADQRLKQGKDLFVLPPLHAAAATALDRAAATLRAAVHEGDRPIADRLIALVREGADPDVGKLRPFELAAAWGCDRREVVTVCLQAVGAGLLDLTWDLICPSCRLSSESLPTLGELGAEGHCQLCELRFDLELEKAVEAVFRPTPAVRALEDAPLCISGPARTPHVVAQRVLPGGGEVAFPAPAAPGRYRLFLRGGAIAAVTVEDDVTAREAVFTADGALQPAAAEVAPGARLVVRRGAAGDTHVKLERLEWASQATTAHYLSTLPAFRRQFGGQLLRPGMTLKVARATILFSDLTASTALYAREGDAAAFKLVQDHFDVLGAVIEAQRGAIVKTIGDAIMAVFEDEADGVRGAVACLRAFEGFRAGSELARRGDVHLKLGVHAGACYVVTANKILDYFGQSVNVAARLQAKADAGEVVVGAGLAALAEASGWLMGARVRERFSTPIKGLDEPIDAARIALE